MQIQRFYLGCLAHASYLVHDAGEAAVIDPQRDVDVYVDTAAELGLTIRWVIETHLHADFVSGHLELARRTGATICIAQNAGALYAHRGLTDGDELPLGNATLRAIATPGHTEEGMCILALEADRPTAVFTGDTLFIGDVGRPDLSPTRTPQQLAGMLFDSLHQKLLQLPDETLVYPAHGAGSLCGRQMSDAASSTIGKERRFNYALQPKTREAFIALLTDHMPPRPEYFQDEVERNRTGAATLDELRGVPELSPTQLFAAQQSGAVILDTRPSAQFAAAHVPGAIHVALSGQFASWAARVLGVDARVLLIAEDPGAVLEARLRLARVGLENVAGSLQGGMLTWNEAGLPTQSVDLISAHDAIAWLESQPESTLVLDVRESSEREAGAIPGSLNIPLAELSGRVTEIDPAKNLLVHCKGGYRSSIAVSLLQAAGLPRVMNLVGGFDAWKLATATHAVN